MQLNLWTEVDKAYEIQYTEHQQLFTYANQPEVLFDANKNHALLEGLERWMTREE